MNTKIIIAIFCLVTSLSAQATLVSRLGGQAVYDTDLDITWLADANAGAGSAFDDGTGGFMTWANANTWAASLTVGGKTDWRLPTADPVCGFNFNCTVSEMGHLFYNELGGTTGQSIQTSGDPDLALFSNIQPSLYWSATEFALFPSEAWEFEFNSGVQNTKGKGNLFFAWAVRSGDVGVVPVPTAVWLFGSGLIGLLGFKHRKS